MPLENRLGERREVEFISNLYREDGHTVIQCNIRDITDRKRVEAELVAASAQRGRQDALLEERTRMAQEIHDTLAQGFTGIITQLEAAAAALARAPQPISPDTLAVSQAQHTLAVSQAQLEKVRLRIGKARDLARESLDEARRSVLALRSQPLEAAPLSEALARFLIQRVLGTSTESRYVLEGIPYTLPSITEHCLLRVGQEAISNAVGHAQAREIAVTLSFDAGRVRLRVRDDGQGYGSPFPGPGRFGIIGMRERADKVRGEFSISAIRDRERRWT